MASWLYVVIEEAEASLRERLESSPGTSITYYLTDEDIESINSMSIESSEGDVQSGTTLSPVQATTFTRTKAVVDFLGESACALLRGSITTEAHEIACPSTSALQNCEVNSAVFYCHPADLGETQDVCRSYPKAPSTCAYGVKAVKRSRVMSSDSDQSSSSGNIYPSVIRIRRPEEVEMPFESELNIDEVQRMPQEEARVLLTTRIFDIDGSAEGRSITQNVINVYNQVLLREIRHLATTHILPAAEYREGEALTSHETRITSDELNRASQLLIPFHTGRNHWILLSIDTVTGMITAMDSMLDKTRTTSILRSLRNLLESIEPDRLDWTIRIIDVPQQTSSSNNCGIAVIVNCWRLLAGAPLIYSPSQLANSRKIILRNLLHATEFQHLDSLAETQEEQVKSTSQTIADIPVTASDTQDSQESDSSIKILNTPMREVKEEVAGDIFSLGEKFAVRAQKSFWRLYSKKAPGSKSFTCSTCENSFMVRKQEGKIIVPSVSISVPSLRFDENNTPIFSGKHRDACKGFALQVVKEIENGGQLPRIQWKLEKFIHVYQGKPWHPEIQSILNARLVESSTLDSASDSESSASGASERFENLFPGKPASYGTGYVIVSVPDQRDSKAAIIYAGISGDSAKTESQASQQWSSRMLMHAKSHLFQKYKEIRFYKVLERASIEAIRYWEFSTVYAKNLIDSTVTQYPLDRPHNDEYYLELRNIEYPSHYLTIETITPQQAEEWMAKAYAEILSALKKNTAIVKKILQMAEKQELGLTSPERLKPSSSNGASAMEKRKLVDTANISKLKKPKATTDCQISPISSDCISENLLQIRFIEDLSDNELILIFEWLRAGDLLTVEQVSHRWNRLARNRSWSKMKIFGSSQFAPIFRKGAKRRATLVEAPRKLTAAKLKTIFERCGRHLLELNFEKFEVCLQPKDFELLSMTSNLTHLNLSGVLLKENALELIAKHLHSTLKSVYLSGKVVLNFSDYFAQDGMGSLITTFFKQCSGIEFLHMSKVEITYESPQPVYTLPDALKYLQMDDSFNYNLFLKAAVDNPAIDLRVVDSSHFHGLNTTLETLNYLSKMPNSCESLEEVAPLFAALKNLRGISLERVDSQIISSIVSNCRQLEHLSLTRNGSAGGESLKDSLIKLANLPNLRSVSLNYLTSSEHDEEYFSDQSNDSNEDNNNAVNDISNYDKCDVYERLLEALAMTGVLESLEIVDCIELDMETVCQLLKSCPKLNSIYVDIKSKLAYPTLFETMDEIRGKDTKPKNRFDPRILHIKQWSIPGKRRHEWVRFYEDDVPCFRIAQEIRLGVLSDKPSYLCRPVFEEEENKPKYNHQD
uniref:Ubiquitin-like protease family profile domain-containing protein n=1 Tax=Ditylenchus dipsaci TaxID=166011 RepID=A0A915DW77_9BILA